MGTIYGFGRPSCARRQDELGTERQHTSGWRSTSGNLDHKDRVFIVSLGSASLAGGRQLGTPLDSARTTGANEHRAQLSGRRHGDGD